MSQQEAAERFADYERRHPRAAARLLKSMGNSYDGTDSGRFQMMAPMPIVAFSDHRRAYSVERLAVMASFACLNTRPRLREPIVRRETLVVVRGGSSRVGQPAVRAMCEDTRNGVGSHPRWCPTACPTSPGFPMVEPIRRES